MKLLISQYVPNFDDPRVMRRVKKVLDWTALTLSSSSPEPVHHKKLREVFGATGNPLTDFMRANLLHQVGRYVKGKQSLSYVLNREGFNKLVSMSKHMVSTSGADQLDSYPDLKTLEFEYKLQSDRYWHPYQNIKREHKVKFWRDSLPFNYDIEACAPTVLLQCAVNAGISPVLLDDLQAYLEDRNGFREHVAALARISPIESKRLINSLFNGAKLAANWHCSAFKTMNYDYRAMMAVQSDLRVRSLVREIRHVWRALEAAERAKQQPSAEDVFAGVARPAEKKLKTSKQKWSFYFAKERLILEAIKESLDEGGIKYFTEHDGFRADRRVEASAIEKQVLAKTGFAIKLQQEQCGV